MWHASCARSWSGCRPERRDTCPLEPERPFLRYWEPQWCQALRLRAALLGAVLAARPGSRIGQSGPTASGSRQASWYRSPRESRPGEWSARAEPARRRLARRRGRRSHRRGAAGALPGGVDRRVEQHGVLTHQAPARPVHFHQKRHKGFGNRIGRPHQQYVAAILALADFEGQR